MSSELGRRPWQRVRARRRSRTPAAARAAASIGWSPSAAPCYTRDVPDELTATSDEPRWHAGLRIWLREPINAITHFLGVLLSIVGTVFLVALAQGDAWKVTAFAIYGGSSILLYLASTLLHALDAPERAAQWLIRTDHAAIFVLIAGSYTPIALVSLRQQSPAWGWTLVAVVWVLAGLGVTFKLAWFRAPRWVSTALYLVLGWLAVVAVVPLVRAIDLGGLLWLLGAGLFYSVGAVIYALKRPSPYPYVFGYHEIWHLFVLAGGACVYVLMLWYVLPA